MSSAAVPAVPPLTATDHVMLAALLAHKVLTTEQVAQACARPVRTVRYRLARLHAARLVGRDRPYADVGSAPAHWWLTTRGVTLAGGSVSRVRRDRPDPHFLAHTTATAAVPLALAAHGPAGGVELVSWLRDEDAWESYPAERALLTGGRWPRIHPDGLAVVAAGGQHRPLFVEVDLGTSTVVRLRAKVGRYLDYAAVGGWRTRHPCCPAVLLLTTSPARAEAFLRAAAHRPFLGAGRAMLIAAAVAVREPERAVREPIWRAAPEPTLLGGPPQPGEPATLRDLLAAHPAKPAPAGYPDRWPA